MKDNSQNFATVTATITRKSYAAPLLKSILEYAAMSHEEGGDFDIETGPIRVVFVEQSSSCFTIKCLIERTEIQVEFDYDAFSSENFCRVHALSLTSDRAMPLGGTFSALNHGMILDWIQLYAEVDVEKRGELYDEIYCDHI